MSRNGIGSDVRKWLIQKYHDRWYVCPPWDDRQLTGRVFDTGTEALAWFNGDTR